ncbi:MAG: PQQ-binding-like beta-propeller repeat protein, partial [Pirellulales bacterium]|nr:PQQ-binding-like beta-propeller repeat protein [Pirellulales bacterium]
MTTEDFIDLLEHKSLAPQSITRQLRAKASQGDQRITPKSILKYLVKKEIVSRAQAKELLETTLIVSDKAESSILGLVPLVDAGEARPPKSTRAPQPQIPSPPSVANPDPLQSSNVLSDSSVEEEPVVLDPIRRGAANFDEGGGDLFSPATNPAKRGLLESDEAALPDRPKKEGKYKKRKRDRSDRKKNEWDSPLLLIGGTGLAILVVAGIVLYWLLGRENADLLLKDANDAFASQSYSQAIAKYQKFVTDFPSHQNFSQAKVRLGMSELWKDTERTSDFAGALATAQRVIKQIEDEPAFASDSGDGEGLSEAKKELSSLLATIAAGLAEQAEASDDPAAVRERIEQINAVLALAANTKYVPQAVRMDYQLNAVRDALTRIEQRQQRETDLAEGLAKMDDAIAAGNTAEAFSLRSLLIEKHPVLAKDRSLHEKVLKIAAAERNLVKFVESTEATTTTRAATGVVAELAMADRQGETVGLEGTVVVKVDGGLYGLSANDGALLWRRFVGLEGDSQPVSLDNGNIVIADSRQQSLLCVDAQSGKIIWQAPLEGVLATPTLAGDKLLVASDAGKLYVVEQTTGDQLGLVQFTQPLRLPPAVNDSGDRIYVLGEHSNIYTLSGSDFSCLGVHYVGHAAGGAAVPPVLALNKVIVADNTGAETSRVVALSLNEQGVIENDVASHRLSGLVTTPLQTAARRVAAVTTLGQAAVFEVSAANDKAGLTILASREAQKEEPLAQFALLHDGHLWVAGNQLTKLAILPTGNQLPVRGLERNFRGDAFDYPVQTAGKLLIHLRRPAASAGAIVAATDAEAAPVWETHLAVPPAGPP